MTILLTTPLALHHRLCVPARRSTACCVARQGVPEAAAPAGRAAPLLERLRSAAAAGALAAVLALAPIAPGGLEAQAQMAISGDAPVLDLARVVPSGRLEGLQQQLRDLERETGWRVRLLTRTGREGPSDEQMRAAWRTDDKTVVVVVDPTSPNIMSFLWGRDVRAVLRPQFFTELQSRYGNIFVVREQGEAAVVLQMMDALSGCLARGGCAVVPGLSMDHYAFTLAVSLAGGVVAGAASKLEPYGFVQRRWVWVAIFAPLWAPLFVNFGLGPVVTRTPDLLPVLGNTAAFALAAVVVGSTGRISRQLGLSTDEPEP